MPIENITGRSLNIKQLGVVQDAIVASVKDSGLPVALATQINLNLHAPNANDSDKYIVNFLVAQRLDLT